MSVPKLPRSTLYSALFYGTKRGDNDKSRRLKSWVKSWAVLALIGLVYAMILSLGDSLDATMLDLDTTVAVPGPRRRQKIFDEWKK